MFLALVWLERLRRLEAIRSLNTCAEPVCSAAGVDGEVWSAAACMPDADCGLQFLKT
jgi:hypothetical protein